MEPSLEKIQFLDSQAFDNFPDFWAGCDFRYSPSYYVRIVSDYFISYKTIQRDSNRQMIFLEAPLPGRCLKTLQLNSCF